MEASKTMDVRGSFAGSGDPDVPQGTVLEVLLAEIENRLRRTILRIVRPTLDQTAEISARLAAITAKVEHHEANLDTCEQLRLDVKKQAEVAEMLKSQISMQFDQARAFESNTTDALAALRSGKMDLEQKLEEQQNDIKRVSREGVRTFEEVERMRGELDEFTQKMRENMSSCYRLVDKNRSELLERVAEIDKHRIDLIDDLFGEGRGITKLRSDLLDLTKFCEPLPAVEAGLAALERRTGSVEARQDDCEVFCDSAKVSYQDFTDNVEDRLKQMNEDFREGMNQLVGHHGALLKVMRQDFATELQASQKLRSQITDIEGKTLSLCGQMQEQLQLESNRLSAIHKEIVQELEDISKRRKKDRHAFDTDIRDMKKDVSVQQEVVGSFHGSLAHFGRVLGLTLESQRVASAMQVQDYADRCSERWLGTPVDLGRKAAPAHTAEMVEQLPYRSENDTNGRSGNPSMLNLVPIDSRAGLARVEYLPGQIAYGGKQYERKDFIVLHDRLLQKAHLAFEKGPPKDPAAALASASQPATAVRTLVPPQPGARGGETTLGQATLGQAGNHGRPGTRSKKCSADGPTDDDSEDPKSTTATTASSKDHRHDSHRHSSRQRPGSRDQPQGTGSRGTMFGSLGETSPPDTGSALPHGVHPLSLPSAKTPVRLPAISIGGEFSEAPAAVDGPGAVGHVASLQQPSATDTGQRRNSRYQAEERIDGIVGRKCHTAR